MTINLSAKIAALVLIVAGASVAIKAYCKGWTHIITAIPHVRRSCNTRSHPILVLGQSQASNTGSSRSISNIEAFALNQGNCYHLRDPMPGTGGRGGSVWPRFANILNQPVTITDIAISGSAIEQWTTPEQINKVLTAIRAFKEKGFSQPTIIWMQGETNAARHNTTAQYESQLQKIIAIAPNNKWIIARESICANINSPSIELNIARDHIAHRYKNVIIGPNIDDIPLSQRQSDRCHMTEANQELIARRLADTFKRIKPIISATPASNSALVGL